MARLPYYLVKNEIESGKLLHIYPQYDLATHPLYLVYPAQNYRTKKHKIVKETIMEWMGEQSGVLIR